MRASSKDRVLTQTARLSSAGREVHLDEWVTPDVCDERSQLRPGKILEWMDVVGVLAATRHCRKPVVTASVDGLRLRHPIRVGERVTMTAAIGYTSERSMGVSVTMTHGLPRADQPPTAVQGYATFVALDGAGNALKVPQIVPEAPVEIARFREGSLRREFRKKLASGQLPSLPELPPNAPPWERIALIREFLKVLPLRMPWDRGDLSRARSRRESYVHKIEPVLASKLNFHETLYGGTLMRWLESAASLSAQAYTGGAAVQLAALHGLTFLRPVRKHVFVHIRCAVAHVAEGLTVFASVQAEDPLQGTYEDTLRAFLTYSCADKTRLPLFECAGDDERALFTEVEHRLALQRALFNLEGTAAPHQVTQ
jgi:acyl-CoA hydrolase